MRAALAGLGEVRLRPDGVPGCEGRTAADEDGGQRGRVVEPHQPDGDPGHPPAETPRSAVATVLWITASGLFSSYVANVASYDAMYGPLGTVVGMMMWFFVTAYAVLLGAELNAELELQTARDSTDGPPRPLGSRGAFVADHVAED